MLHGFLGSSHCWRSLTEQLQSDFRCISLDLLGFGDSAKPVLRYDVATEVAFVRAFVEALELSPCAVVGHSFGGWVASAYALAYPEAVSKLILVAPAGIRDDSFCGRYDHLRPLLWDTPVVDWALGLARPVAAILGQTPTLRTITGFRQSLMANPAACSFLRDRSRPEDAIDTVEQDIHRLRVPTLVITGDRDDTIPRWHSETYAQEIPDARLEVIPNADHSLPQNYSTELALVIAPFLHTHLQPDAVF
ncbi:alpha/beta hydrolase [Leptothermofonsia sichuanensis E412]|nr:alpha/beta hydrolase [Leptothermofonsia sichuanensis E412]